MMMDRSYARPRAEEEGAIQSRPMRVGDQIVGTPKGRRARGRCRKQDSQSVLMLAKRRAFHRSLVHLVSTASQSQARRRRRPRRAGSRNGAISNDSNTNGPYEHVESRRVLD